MRVYYDETLKVTKENIEELMKELFEIKIFNVQELEEFILKYSELSIIINEEEAWKYINMTRFANEKKYSDDFNDYYANVFSKYEAESFKLNKKIYENKYFGELPKERYRNYKLILSNEIEMFEEKNIPLQIKEIELSTKYGEINSKMTVEFMNQTYTMAQMKKFLKDSNRKIREDAWKTINKRLEEDHVVLENLFDELKEIRIEMAKNKGYQNYRDYMHDLKGRISYKPEDLYKFHDAVEKIVVPFLKELHQEKKEKLNLKTLKPWDMDVDPDGIILRPFKDIKEFMKKSLNTLGRVKKDYEERLKFMEKSDFLDLENREGKAPGGYNYPLHETGAPFIFMNAVGLHDDMVTLMHESGHAMHSFATSSEPLISYKDTPSEVAELASMSMELISMEAWDEFYTDDTELKKAKLDQLYRTMEILPWVMIVDSFQHWIYLNPNHTSIERDKKFGEIMDRFNTGVDWKELSKEKQMRWLMQLHIFEVPFYYIEYAISQLGAIGIYKNYKKNRETGINKYNKFLKLGYSKPVDEIYKTAGIKFDFSKENLKELVDFIKMELKN
ncbi:M3 family oligoendopeptidase [Fusobacteria bacterium ZRK30]|nr:M3 family oligoendopeptidase [Fusobacteria bacterium ZRK30]